MAPYRVLVVDDSAFMRKIICDLIGQNDKFQIVATAKTGREALEAHALWKPDVITLDLEMPEMNGIEALQQIMKRQPAPVIMLSGISEDNTRETIKALQFGAFDFIRKPTDAKHVPDFGQMLWEKLFIAVSTYRKPSTEAPVIRNPLPVNPIPQREPVQQPLVPPAVREERQDLPSKAKAQRPPDKPAAKIPEIRGGFSGIVAVGTSTGGPRALHELITALPADFPMPVLVVQHMPPKFTHSLAQRLNTFSKLHVCEAKQGETVSAGCVYIAPGGFHMKLYKHQKEYRIQLSDEEPRHGHRPSVDVMFESLLPFQELRRHTVIMTGMGSDGTKGAKALIEQGIETAIAEAEETCVVYGMPRAAIEGGAAHTVLPLYAIASHLVKVADRQV